MKKDFIPVSVIVFVVLSMVCLSPFTPRTAFAEINCTDTTDYTPTRMDQVPVPWVFWMADNTDPNIYMPWVRLSPSSGETLYIRWYYAFCPSDSPTTPSLDELFWDFDTDQPASIPDTTGWVCGNPNDLQSISPGGDGIMLDAPIGPIRNYSAILVAFEIMNEESETIGHSINEAIINSEIPAIDEVAVNFDMKNNTGHNVTGFELDFWGAWLSCMFGDVLDAKGFIVGEEGNWGYDILKPLIVRYIYSQDKTEVIWVDQERPLESNEWVHLGIHFHLFDFIVNDTTAEVAGYMTAMEICDETDDDNDGYSECQGDCDDTDPTTYPGATELCDGKDNDCDGIVPADEQDADGDGFMICAGDCDDSDPTTYPGAPELCDGKDNDCDGVIDEGCTPPVCEPLTQGFWKRICDGTFGEKKSHPETPEGFGDNEDQDLCGCVQVKDKDTSDPCVKADAQYAALLFNIKYGFLTGSCEVKPDVIQAILDEHNSGIPVEGISDVEDVTALIASLLEPADPDPDDCKLAQGLADAINTRAALLDE